VWFQKWCVAYERQAAESRAAGADADGDVGVVAGQLGRQWMPVVMTAKKNSPSKRASRPRTAWYLLSSAWSSVITLPLCASVAAKSGGERRPRSALRPPGPPPGPGYDCSAGAIAAGPSISTSSLRANHSPDSPPTA
jgi:hypothetical protein